MLPEVVRTRTNLTEPDLEWLSQLQADWHIIADLSFSDLVLWVPDRAGPGWWAIGQQRPTTGPTALIDDVVGSAAGLAERGLLERARREIRIIREGDVDRPVRVEAIPVRRGSRVIAVVTRTTKLQGVRTPSRLEQAYLQSATDLTRMIAGGHFPFQGQEPGDLRVGDGFIRLDVVGQVTYASPNALSVFRRLGHSGDLAGQELSALTRALVPPRMRPDEETISAVLGARVPRDTELANGLATIALRAIPLRPDGQLAGGLLLARDVTELRRRERQLITKEATIREIHHRVKNNLQTVAALLRMQARRVDGPGREALEEAVRRVGAIAVVHDTLAQTFEEAVEFDAVADQLLRLVNEVGSREAPVEVRRTGSFGAVSSDVATPLAMVLTELVQNALEHAFPDGRPGRIEVRATVTAEPEHVVEIVVTDDGVGLPEDFDPVRSSSLGLSIVRTLVGELGGSVDLSRGADGGTRVELTVPVAWRG